MARTIRTPAVVLSTTKTKILGCAIGTQVAVSDLILSNPTGSSVTASLYLYNADTASEAPLLVAYPLAANAAPYRLPSRICLQPGDEIRAFASAATSVTAALAHAVVSAANPIAKGFSFKGNYAAGNTYAANDVVSYSNASYVSRIDGNTGNQPDTSPTSWQVLVAQAAAISYATAADIWAGTDNTKAVTPKAINDSFAFAALGSITGTVALNFTNSSNQTGTASGNITLGQHTGGVDGEPVQFEIVQPASGGPYTLAANTTYNKFPGGTPFTLSTGAGARDILYGTTRVIGGTTLAHWTGFGKDIR